MCSVAIRVISLYRHKVNCLYARSRSDLRSELWKMSSDWSANSCNRHTDGVMAGHRFRCSEL